MAESISIVIPVFNKSELTDRCLDSLYRHSTNAHEIFIINNGSTDDTSVVLKKWKLLFVEKGWSFEIVENSVNVGFGRAMNQGARLSSGNYLALVNNDTWILPNWDGKLIKAMNLYSHISLICPYINETRPFDENRIVNDAIKFESRNENRTRNRFCAVFMFFRATAFKDIGMFDERFFVTYEDTDLKERMDRRGYKYLTVGSCFVWHQSMATRGSAALPSNYEIQGKKLFVDKWGFDPSLREKTQFARMLRRWDRFMAKLGLL